MLDRLRLPLLLAWPSLALIGLVVVPFAMLVRISFATPGLEGLWGSGVTLDSYAGLLDRSFAMALVYSLVLAVLVAAASLGLGLPLTFFITRIGRRQQVLWLVFLLTTLTLSDVLISFSWQVMLSRRVGLSNLLVLLGLMDRPDSLTPGLGALSAALIYVVIPFTVLTLFPTMSALAPELIEAARTLGASPLAAFRTVVVPLMRRSVAIAFLVSAVLTLGAYVPPLVLGRPRNWTMAVLISNTALNGHNIPRAAAMSVSLLLAVLVPTAFAAWVARARGLR
jgi:putative spermidine/putrescine transport system permease protein